MRGFDYATLYDERAIIADATSGRIVQNANGSAPSGNMYVAKSLYCTALQPGRC